MWCYLVNGIVIIAGNLDQSPLLLDIHYALLTHTLLFGYNNLGSGLFGIALFSWHLYLHSVHCNNTNCSTNIHLPQPFICVYYHYFIDFLSIIQLLACISTGFILFFSDVCLSESHRLEQFLAATTTMR